MRISTASAAIKRAEAALGPELFIRTTRQLPEYTPRASELLSLENDTVFCITLKR